MSISVLLVCCLPQAAGLASAPACPDFAALIRVADPTATLPENERAARLADLREAEALAQYLTRTWVMVANKSVDPDTSVNVTMNILTITSQFDTALTTLNPNPTGSELAARIRVYRAYFCLIKSVMKRAKDGGLDVKKIEWQFRASFHRFDRLYRQYIARVASCGDAPTSDRSSVGDSWALARGGRSCPDLLADRATAGC